MRLLKIIPSIPPFFLFAFDILILPMFHIVGAPVKISYMLLGLWFIYRLIIKQSFNRQFLSISYCIGILIICGMLGELYMQIRFPGMQHSETIWSITIYLMALFSFGFALSNLRFNFIWLYYIIFIAIFLNFASVFLSAYLPWINSFYYSAQSAEDLGLADVTEIADMLRPRGIFGNPNLSMLQVNITYLFIVISVRRNLMPPVPKYFSILVILLPICLAVVLGSRSELLVCLLYSFFFAKFVWGRKALLYLAGSSFLMVAILIWVTTLLEQQTGFEKADTIKYAIERFTKTNEELLTTDDENQGISRPLILWETASSRFLQSPIFGSGFNAVPVMDAFPFDYSPRYYHNDWLRIIVTGGVIGLLVVFWLLRQFGRSIHCLIIVPFILPALTNTFILSIPSIMFYFFMLGIFTKYIKPVKSAAILG